MHGNLPYPSAQCREVAFPWCGTAVLRSAEEPHSAKAAQCLLPTSAPGLHLPLLKPNLERLHVLPFLFYSQISGITKHTLSSRQEFNICTMITSFGSKQPSFSSVYFLSSGVHLRLFLCFIYNKLFSPLKSQKTKDYPKQMKKQINKSLLFPMFN